LIPEVIALLTLVAENKLASVTWNLRQCWKITKP